MKHSSDTVMLSFRGSARSHIERDTGRDATDLAMGSERVR